MILFVSIAKFKEIERYFEKIKDTLREGCKPIPLASISKCTFWFYLNYEGCKLEAREAWISGIQQFYLNYEGCKQALRLPRAASIKFLPCHCSFKNNSFL